MPFSLLELPYLYDALEPHLDARTMEIHHTRHHQKYTDKLNEAIAKHPELESRGIEALLSDLSQVPEDIRAAVRNHGGGYCNHNLFWTFMSPDGGGAPSETLMGAINTAFTDFASFRQQFSDQAATLFGSGWTWLVKDKSDKLAIINTFNQDSPLSTGATPLLALDVWEHVYYLKWQNKRPEYIEAWWNVVNWKEVGRRYQEAK